MIGADDILLSSTRSKFARVAKAWDTSDQLNWFSQCEIDGPLFVEPSSACNKTSLNYGMQFLQHLSSQCKISDHSEAVTPLCHLVSHNYYLTLSKGSSGHSLTSIPLSKTIVAEAVTNLKDEWLTPVKNPSPKSEQVCGHCLKQWRMTSWTYMPVLSFEYLPVAAPKVKSVALSEREECNTPLT